MARINVIYKPTGQKGSVEETEFNPAMYAVDNAEAPATKASPTKSTGGGIIEGLIEALTKPAVDAGKLALGTGFEGVRAVDSALGNKDAYDLLKGKKNPFLSRGEIEKSYANPLDTIKNVGKKAAGAASYAVPFGRVAKGAGAGSKLLKGVLLPGAATGGLSGASKDDATIGSVGKDALIGAAGAGVLQGGVKAVGGGYNLINKLIGSGRGALANEAAQGISKASPTVWRKAVEEHGVDLNNLTKKYFPQGDYESALGAISERGKGGVLKSKLTTAESKIQDTVTKNSKARIDGSEIITALRKEEATLRNKLGGKKAADDLAEIIAEAETRYKGGLPLSKSMEIIRDANEKFGKSIVDDTGGAILSDSQKMEANVLKKIIKKTYPDIADALRTQEEIYTLRPVLSHARSIGETRGSQIRTGSFSSLTDLVNPISYGKAAMSKPDWSSRLLNVGGGQSRQMDTSNPILNQILGQGGSRLASGLGQQNPNIEDTNQQGANSTQYDDQSNNIQGQTNHDGSVADNQSLVNQEPILDESGQWRWDAAADDWVPTDQAQGDGSGLPTKEELQAAMVQDLQNGGKNITELKTIIDTLYPKEEAKEAKAKKYSEGDKKFLLAKNEATKAMSALDKGDVTSGKVAAGMSRIEEFTGQQKPSTTAFKAQLATARTAARNALLGANMSDKELESYLDAIFSYSNEPTIIKQKLATFIQSMQDYEDSIAGTGTGIEDLMNGQAAQ